MAEVLAEYRTVVVKDGDRAFYPRACGGPMDDSRWQGWIEFVELDASAVVRTPRETTQPNRTDLEYWATGLTRVYFDGALTRALHPRVVVEDPPSPPPAFTAPAAASVTIPPIDRTTESVLDPFSVYRKGERLLRDQLGALSPWHLVNIIRAYNLSDADPVTLSRLRAPMLIEMIVNAVRA